MILIFIGFTSWIFKQSVFEFKRKKRRDYYRNVYLKSEAWQRKRYVVLKRDNWRCEYCGAKATQVHHTRYAYNIGREPIDWLVSVCNSCHEELHN
ncbi:HNH endonuclease [Epilithonimonas sp. UC225_85]|uniref:HNH endonuclease n=1 Tax=Epilithonimonas sp. UC225_85 TaxID=3350167 RepID=UPI0036D26AEE